MDIITWITGNWVTIGGLILLIIRVVETIMQMIGKENPTLIAKIVAFVKSFFSLS